jgi:hypothetical protein
MTRGAPGAALSWEVGTGAAVTRGAPGAALSWEVGTGAAMTRDAPEGVQRWEAGAAPGVVSGDFFLVASYCPTQHSRVIKKSMFSPPPLLLRSRRRYGFFFDFFRPCPSVAMSGALQRHQLS